MLETVEEYRIVCPCHGPLLSGLTKERAEKSLENYTELVDDGRVARIQKRTVTYSEWTEVNAG